MCDKIIELQISISRDEITAACNKYNIQHLEII